MTRGATAGTQALARVTPDHRPEAQSEASAVTVVGGADAPLAPAAAGHRPSPSAALIALARALGRASARRHGARRAHSMAEAALLLLLAAAVLAAALALRAR